MSERKRIRYHYEGIESWEENHAKLHEIINEDTGGEPWPETKSLPPIGFTAPLTTSAIQKLKGLSGVEIIEISDDD
ncbi:hypothetical protein BDV26DRAFT_269445 [Aspergillus bertholletiae]|uniref:Uncharacterized protein n=1 Tax=Aspergillus bertholletiae TaxID=1226010 RepID=A0A5N7AXW2_9EURO|nr:hypothetical protein BDV26DRAFT_269445 [Aspergillus bertholletiae]